jgi:hypothetical protein
MENVKKFKNDKSADGSNYSDSSFLRNTIRVPVSGREKLSSKEAAGVEGLEAGDWASAL